MGRRAYPPQNRPPARPGYFPRRPPLACSSLRRSPPGRAARLRIDRRARPVTSAAGTRLHDRAFERRRREERSDLERFHRREREGPDLRREVRQVVNRDALSLECGGLRGNRLCRRSLLSGNIGRWNRPLLNGPEGLAILSVERVDE